MRNYESSTYRKGRGYPQPHLRSDQPDGHETEAFPYFVKNPASNEVSVCISDDVIYPGTYVVAPTRFGLDMGIVIGNVPASDGVYTPGCDRVRGACCLNCSSGTDAGEETDADLAAWGDCESEGFEPAQWQIVSVTELPPLPKTDEVDDSGCWETRYSAPVKMHVSDDLDRIDRVATPEDMKRYHANLRSEEEAMEICREKVARHHLNMKLVTAHFLLGEPKALFFFTADDRVDFRELVKDLVSVFRLRIELRQIGVRDESRVLGGLAVCGRDFCCHCVTDKLNPVTIRMAKEQNLSLNSMKISGPCGRLLCCLSYENDFYLEEKRDYPPEGSKLKAGSEICKVTEVNILSKKISMTTVDGRVIIIPRQAVFFCGQNNRWEITPEYQAEYFSL
ncbi:MAG: hypothetical protein J5785_01540 [Spirochaetales bacterium]|nr:hypothetical protein [Spirochaetales bacterium]